MAEAEAEAAVMVLMLDVIVLRLQRGVPEMAVLVIYQQLLDFIMLVVAVVVMLEQELEELEAAATVDLVQLLSRAQMA
jgi:hypothetical protein